MYTYIYMYIYIYTYIYTAIVGISYPLLGYFLAEIIAVFYFQDPVRINNEASFWAYMFILIGGSQVFGIHIYIYIYIYIY
jgi:hypothetical protein